MNPLFGIDDRPQRDIQLLPWHLPGQPAAAEDDDEKIALEKKCYNRMVERMFLF